MFHPIVFVRGVGRGSPPLGTLPSKASLRGGQGGAKVQGYTPCFEGKVGSTLISDLINEMVRPACLEGSRANERFASSIVASQAGLLLRELTNLPNYRSIVSNGVPLT